MNRKSYTIQCRATLRVCTTRYQNRIEVRTNRCLKYPKMRLVQTEVQCRTRLCTTQDKNGYGIVPEQYRVLVLNIDRLQVPQSPLHAPWTVGGYYSRNMGTMRGKKRYTAVSELHSMSCNKRQKYLDIDPELKVYGRTWVQYSTKTVRSHTQRSALNNQGVAGPSFPP